MAKKKNSNKPAASVTAVEAEDLSVLTEHDDGEEMQDKPVETADGAETAELKKRIAELEGELEKAREKLDGSEADKRSQEVRKAELDKREKWLLEKEKEYLDKNAKLIERESQLKMDEINALNGFADQKEEMFRSSSAKLDNLLKELDDVRGRIVAADKEAAEKRQKAWNDLMEKAEKESAVIKAKAEKEADQLKEDAKNECSEKLAEAESARKEAEELRQAAENLKEEADKETANIGRIREGLMKRTEDLVNERYSDLKDKLSHSSEKYDRLTAETAALREKIDGYEKTQRSAGGRSLEDVIASENELMELIKSKDNELLKLNLKLVSQKSYKEKAKAYDELFDKLSSEYEAERMELERLRLIEKANINRESRVKVIVEEKEAAIREKNAVRAQVEALSSQISMLQETVERLKTMAERPAEYEARVQDIERIEFAKRIDDFLDTENEIEWLEGIYSKMNESGIRINKRLFYAFHTSLKTAEWSPITILSGVSGTGKSLMPKLYARYGGFYFLPLAVQPDWDSSQSLFGFFNALDNKFNATTLLSAMVQFSKSIPDENGELPKRYCDDLSDSMMIVLLDEMNLAHVELYFSELLSKLEDRRGESDDVFIEVDLGSGLKKYRVELSRNILWVGTMNDDETTKTLSDKVIDRSNMLGFRSPKEFARRTEAVFAESDDRRLSKKQWDKWIDAAIRFSDDDETIIEYKSYVEQINGCLNEVGRALGHRVWQAVENYISNHPLCIKAYAGRAGDPDRFKAAVKRAFEEALVYKVMPKLKGIEITQNTRQSCFNKIGDVIDECAKGLLTDYNRAMSDDRFLWNSADYLEEDDEDNE